VLGGKVGGTSVVDGQRADALDLTTDSKHRLAGAVQCCKFALQWLHRHTEHAVHALAQQEVVENLGALALGFPQVV